jgi:gamma-glutamyltranspeptidase/glutathione hydrolase
MKRVHLGIVLVTSVLALGSVTTNAKTVKPPLHGQSWMAVTGKPLVATAGATVFMQGGNAVDDACAMIGATSTMWNILRSGGETQALIHYPHTGKVIGVDVQGVAPTGVVM